MSSKVHSWVQSARHHPNTIGLVVLLVAGIVPGLLLNPSVALPFPVSYISQVMLEVCRLNNYIKYVLEDSPDNPASCPDSGVAILLSLGLKLLSSTYYQLSEELH